MPKEFKDIAVICDQNPSYTRVYPQRVPSLLSEYEEMGIVLPTNIPFENGKMRVMKNHYYQMIAQKGKPVFEYLIHPGFAWDLASIPDAVPKWIVDNDDIELADGVIPHDFNYALNLIPYHLANALFYWMIRAFKGGSEFKERTIRFKARAAYTGVQTRKGLRSYIANDPETHWMKEFVTVIDYRKNPEGEVLHSPQWVKELQEHGGIAPDMLCMEAMQYEKDQIKEKLNA